MKLAPFQKKIVIGITNSEGNNKTGTIVVTIVEEDHKLINVLDKNYT